MRTFIMIALLILVTACGKGGAGGGSSKPAAVINPDLYGHTWHLDYSVGPQLYSDLLTANDDEVVIETHRTGSLIGQKNWTIKPLTATTMRVSDGVDVFEVSYEVNGNVLDICYEDGSCDTFMY